MRIGEQARIIGKIKAAADNKTDPDLLCRVMGAHNAGKAVAIGDRNRLMAERGRSQHQLVRMRGAAQEREVARDLQLRVAQRRLTKRRHG